MAGEGHYFCAYMLDNFTSNGANPNASVMDSALWSQLPEDIVFKILFELPRSSQARFEAVSRAWRLRQRSAEFRARSAAMAFYSGRFLCGITHRDLYREDIPFTARYKIHKLNFAFLPQDFQNLTDMPTLFPSTLWVVSPLAFHVQSGLIVLVRRTPEQLNLCVVNLMNETWKELAAPPDPLFKYVLAVWPVQDEAGDRHFKLAMGTAHTAFYYAIDIARSGFVYYSKTGAWTNELDILNSGPGGDTDFEKRRVDTAESTSIWRMYNPYAWFQYEGLFVDGTLSVKIRRPSREGTECESIFVISTDWKPCEDQTSKARLCLDAEQRFGSMIVTSLYFFISSRRSLWVDGFEKVTVYLAYDIPLGAWKLLHAFVFRFRIHPRLTNSSNPSPPFGSEVGSIFHQV